MVAGTQQIPATLVRLRAEHRNLDTSIAALAAQPGANQLQLSRMKRRKLQLKDDISRLESQLIPDLDA